VNKKKREENKFSKEGWVFGRVEYYIFIRVKEK
jgi:hypothetical protein